MLTYFFTLLLDVGSARVGPSFYAPTTTSLVGDNVASGEFAIETMNSSVFVADPSVEGYDEFLPLDKVRTSHLLGSMIGAVVHMYDGGKAIDVQVSNYMQGRTLECVYR